MTCMESAVALYEKLGFERLDKPLVALLGRAHAALPTSITIGIQDAAATLAEAREHLAKGFRVLKIKLGDDLEVDLERLALLRAENLRFDQDTSMGHNPVKQKEWLNSVMTRLQNSADFAAAGPLSHCRVDRATREAIDKARSAIKDAVDQASAGRLLEQAETAVRPPECDNLRAQILADKAADRAAGKRAAD